MPDSTYRLVEFVALAAIILMLLWLKRKLSAMPGAVDSHPILAEVGLLRSAQEQVDRAVRDELSRNRQEFASHSASLRTEIIGSVTSLTDSNSHRIQNLSASNEKHLEAIRGGLEKRFESFSADSMKRAEQLTLSASNSASKLQGDLCGQLVEFRNSLDRTVQDTNAIQREHTLAITVAFQGLQSAIDEKIQNLIASSEKHLEAIRGGLEKRFESFSADSMKRAEQLTLSASNSASKLQGDLRGQLVEFRNSLDRTVRDTNAIQREHTLAITAAFQGLQSAIDEKQKRFQTAVDSKLSDVSDKTSLKLTGVETTFTNAALSMRQETSSSFKGFGESTLKTLGDMTQVQKTELEALRSSIGGRLAGMQTQNETKLEQMRQTVDEKLQGTLETRLGESFKLVSDRLEQVHKGLGEMQTLAAGVGDLKRVLTNVKIRGTWGEVQLGAILEQILTPEQYGSNVATSGTGERVEFAIKLPGRNREDVPLWLPIDAKFPVEDFQRLIDASETGDVDNVERASRRLDATLRSCARSISEKYLAPPATTDFAILFLPTESLYAEAVRRPGLAETIQRDYRVVLSGPSTLAALLNSLQMGFRTLAVQQRSSEVWELLGAVKCEFLKYADVLANVKKKLLEASNTIEKAEVRTRVIQRKLRDVEDAEAPAIKGFGEEVEDISEGLLLAAGANSA